MSKKKSALILTTFIILLVLGAVFAFVSLDKGQLGIHDYVGYAKAIKLGLDLKGGVYAEYTAVRTEDMTDEQFKSRLDGTIKNFEKLLFDRGYPEAVVTNSGNRIRVEVPNVKNTEEVLDLIGNPAEVLFKKTNDDNFDKNSPDVVLTGKEVKQAGVSVDENGKYVIALEFNDEGTKKFSEATGQLVATRSPIHIFIDRKLLMSPTVNAQIANGKAVIEGNYSYEQAYDLAVRIQSGSLPLNLKLDESNTISPTLGEESIKMGVIACGVGLLIILIILIAMYGLMGVVASFSLLAYTFLYLFIMAIFPWVQLTLPGIAGILLSIGMAVDANIIIYERVKEEFRSSNGTKTIETCIKRGFHRSFGAIFDGNITTIIGAIVLMIFGVSSIKGFAITLLIGIIISLFTSLVLTRILLKTFVAFQNEKPSLYGLRLSKVLFTVDLPKEATVDTSKKAKKQKAKKQDNKKGGK